MSTKLGMTLLVVGGYVMALGFGGINANSGGAQWLFSLVLVLGIVMAGWAVVLPWNGGGQHGAPTER
ncbi:MAG: hypothetical protein HOV83_17235 [Catenulispora sp.]|nr:hypothetical protein [Catenulispora sp.]